MIYIFALYVLGFIAFYSHIRVLHSPKGRYSELPPSTEDVVLCFVPVINLAFGCLGWLISWPYKEQKIKKEKKVRNYKRFFGIKQPNPTQEQTLDERRHNIEALNIYMATTRIQPCTRGITQQPQTNNDTTINYPKKFSLKNKKTV